MKIEFRVAIAPTPAFYSTIRLAALSLRALGAPYDSAHVVVSVGDCASFEEVSKANTWAEDFPLAWRIVSHDEFRKRSLVATGNDRLLAPTEADIVIICDADVCLVDRMDDVLTSLAATERPTIAGLPAHHGPFGRDSAMSEQRWRNLFLALGLGEPNLSMRYSTDTDDVLGRAPAYFNFGLVAFNRSAFAAAAPIYDFFVRQAAELIARPFYQCQIGLSLTIAAAAIETRVVSHAYNCANDDAPFEAPPEVRLDSPADIRAIHFLRNNELDRRTFLADPAAHAAFLSATNLNRVNSRLRDHVVSLSRQHELLFH